MNIETLKFEDEMSQDFLDYCYQTNVERAFPAIDGLKPGQRACLYEMYRKGYTPNKAHVKSAKVAGGVMAELWPHGDVAIYETFARMSQEFTNNSPLCEFHGSNGNQIIPEAASSRYTEVRLSKLGMEMFNGVKKKNVPFILNFDETVEWPALLPSPIPFLLINGSEGIGTTIAQKFLPYNINEVSEAYKNYILTGEMDYTLSPSFPSGGIIINKKDMPTILKTGKGKVTLRATAEVNDNYIDITEICYQTCVRDLMEEFKKLYDADELPGVEDIQNKSGKKGIRIRIICEKGANPQSVLKILYKKTNLQKSYSANQNLLVGKVPQLVSTEKYFELLYKHNDECLVREYQFDMDKAAARAEECEGLLIAIAHIDDIIAIVRGSEDKDDAANKLIKKYDFTERQVRCILKMTIGQLTKLDGVKIEKELEDLKVTIANLSDLLKNSDKRKEVMVTVIDNLIKKYGCPRKTQLMQIETKPEEADIAEVVPEDCVVVMTKTGNIKRVPSSAFKVQKRRGKGIKNQDDILLDVISTNTIDTLMCFTDKGKMYRLVVDNVPVGTNTSKGVGIGSLIPIDYSEKVIAVTSLHRKTNPEFVVFITKNGLVKKTKLEEYMNTKRKTGVIAIKIKDGDSIADVTFLDNEDLFLITKSGMGIHFATDTINPIGRNTAGVKSIKLMDNDEVICGLPLHKDTDNIALFTKQGLGKRIELKEIPIQGRGGRGIKISDSELAGAAMVDDNDVILIIGRPNNMCIAANEISKLGKTANGVMVIKGSTITSIVKL